MDSTTLFGRRRLYWINLAILFPALVSLSTAVRNGLGSNRSQDFQWSGAHLFALHRDPYLVYLLKDPGHDFLKSQVPNYLQEFYVLLWPLGRISEHAAAVSWMFLNLLFATASVLMLGRIFKLSRGRTLLLGLIFATTAPFRVAIANGQQSLLELMLLVAALAFPTRAEWPLGLSYFKYSFTPIVFFYVAFRKGYRTLLLAALPPLAGWLIFWLSVGGSPLQTAIEPVLVGRVGVLPGTADLVSFLMFIAPRWVPFGLVLTILLSVLLAYMIHRRARSLPQAGAALAICCLFLFPHLIYDLVLLIVPAALLLSRIRLARLPTIASTLSLIGLAFVVPVTWAYGSALIHIYCNFILLIVLYLSIVSSPVSDNPEASSGSMDAIPSKAPLLD